MGSWTICVGHWNSLRKDLPEKKLIVANTLSMEMLIDSKPELAGINPPGTAKICPICVIGLPDSLEIYRKIVEKLK